MPKITYIEHSGKEHVVEAPNGQTVMEAAVKHAVPGIDADCGGACACATCHVIIREGFDSLEEPDDNELDHLDTAWGASVLSRLSCQTKVGEGDITVEIPKYSRNHAREE